MNKQIGPVPCFSAANLGINIGQDNGYNCPDFLRSSAWDFGRHLKKPVKTQSYT